MLHSSSAAALHHTPPRPEALERGQSAAARWHGLLAAAVIAGFMGLSLWFSLVVPAFETPDEIYHYAFARHLAAGNSLPIQTVDGEGPWRHEGTQAPLYYWLVGRLTASIDQSDFDQLSKVNPRANLGNPLYPGNKNHMLYSARQPDMQGANLALHIGRWFSISLSSLTLLLIYRIARLAFPVSPRRACLTLLLVASVPQFAFIGASLTNDNLVILVSTALLYWLARLVSRTAQEPIRSGELLLLGVWLGVAALSKLQGLGLIPLAAIALLGLAWLRREWQLLLRALFWVGLPAVAIAGWWYWRNYTLYGEWLGVQQLLTLEGLRRQPQTLQNLWGELRGLRYSFWGLFGWFSILLPNWIYLLLDGISLLAVGGLLLVAARSRRRLRQMWVTDPASRVKLLLALWALLLGTLMLYWATFATSSQGRLLFPAMAAFGVLLVTGLHGWARLLPERLAWSLLALLPVGLCAASLYALLILLPNTYRAVQPIAALPAQAEPVGKLYGDRLELVAVELSQGRYRPGDDVPVTLYLRTVQRLTTDYELFVQLLDQNNSELGNVTTHPGWGRNPTSMWLPGALYADRYLIRVQTTIDDRSPLLARLYVGFMDAGSPDDGDEELLMVAGDETELAGRTIGFVVVEPSTGWHQGNHNLRPIAVNFAQQIRLSGYEYPAFVSRTGSQELAVTLSWQALGSPQGDYISFVHLTTLDGQLVVGFDQPPAQDRFPTRYWQAGDTSLSTVGLRLPSQLPAGKYQIWVGLYDTASPNLDRLPIVSADRAVQDSRLLLGTINVR